MTANCSWTGYHCDCTAFPYKEDGLIPAKCEQRITLDMIPLRSVNPKLKALHKQYLKELERETYDPKDPKWGTLLHDAKRRVTASSTISAFRSATQDTEARHD